jgi:hypothetical protein
MLHKIASGAPVQCLNVKPKEAGGDRRFREHREATSRASDVLHVVSPRRRKRRTPLITIQDVTSARAIFLKKEPRDVFYRAASELVRLALKKSTKITIAEALAVLLRTWNQQFYRFRGFRSREFADIETLLSTHRRDLKRLRAMNLCRLTRAQTMLSADLFESFERRLGPVGAAKALHLMAPRVFPLWDRKIATRYGVTLSTSGANRNRYAKFMAVAREQCRALAREGYVGNPLKAVDEYNFCKFTKKW